MLDEINYIKHLNGVFQQFLKDGRLNPTHISLYMALFQLWNHNFFKPEFLIHREEVMSLSKIGSKSTYHRCIRDLDCWKYIRYTPSHNPFKGSRVQLFDFGTSSVQAQNPNHPENGTGDGQALVPFIKHKQTSLNNKNGKSKSMNFPETPLSKNNQEVDHFRDNLRTTHSKNYSEPL